VDIDAKLYDNSGLHITPKSGKSSYYHDNKLRHVSIFRLLHTTLEGLGW